MKDNIQNWVIMQGKILVSYDVESLYPSVPIKKAIDIILKLIEDRGGLRNITDLSLTSIKALMEFCLCNSYFEFEQTWVGLECGMIGLDLTGIVADIYMEDFEMRAISTSLNPPRKLYKYVDDCFARMHEGQ